MDIVFRASVMFEIVYALLRLLDKRELAEVAPFELDLLVAVGDLIQQRVTHNEFSTIRAILANSTFAFWALVLNDLAFRPRRAETLIGGKPSMLTREGTVMPGAFTRNRLADAGSGNGNAPCRDRRDGGCSLSHPGDQRQN